MPSDSASLLHRVFSWLHSYLYRYSCTVCQRPTVLRHGCDVEVENAHRRLIRQEWRTL